MGTNVERRQAVMQSYPKSGPWRACEPGEERRRGAAAPEADSGGWDERQGWELEMEAERKRKAAKGCCVTMAES